MNMSEYQKRRRLLEGIAQAMWLSSAFLALGLVFGVVIVVATSDLSGACLP
jgi:hypothetical protein